MVSNSTNSIIRLNPINIILYTTVCEDNATPSSITYGIKISTLPPPQRSFVLDVIRKKDIRMKDVIS
jgi:hypothetical protein